MLALAASALLAAAPTAAQPAAGAAPRIPAAFTFTRIPAPAEPEAIPLYPGVAPGSEGSRAAEIWDRMGNGDRIVRNVVRPTLTPFLPDPARATGAAVIVAPGGGYKMLSMDNEGWPVAKWLADRGIAAFVLKYRVHETAADEQAFLREMGAVFEAAMRSGTRPPDLQEPRAVHDALQALRMVRKGAESWRIDPKRVGMIGFSAGAMTTLRAVLEGKAGEKPDYIGYIYGPMTASPSTTACSAARASASSSPGERPAAASSCTPMRKAITATASAAPAPPPP